VEVLASAVGGFRALLPDANQKGFHHGTLLFNGGDLGECTGRPGGAFAMERFQRHGEGVDQEKALDTILSEEVRGKRLPPSEVRSTTIPLLPW
jgi:hypothetical protein